MPSTNLSTPAGNVSARISTSCVVVYARVMVPIGNSWFHDNGPPCICDRLAPDMTSATPSCSHRLSVAATPSNSRAPRDVIFAATKRCKTSPACTARVERRDKGELLIKGTGMGYTAGVAAEGASVDGAAPGVAAEGASVDGAAPDSRTGEITGLAAPAI